MKRKQMKESYQTLETSAECNNFVDNMIITLIKQTSENFFISTHNLQTYVRKLIYVHILLPINK